MRKRPGVEGLVSIPSEVKDHSGTQSEIVLLMANRAAVEELRAQILCLNNADGDSVSKSVIYPAAYRI